MSASGARQRPVRRGAYILPSLFTIGNLFLGFFALMQTLKAVLEPDAAGGYMDAAAKAIGYAVLFDGFDGRIARMMGTDSEFGREFDSLADVITFGAAPAVLAFAWGLSFLDPLTAGAGLDHLHRVGWFLSFLFLMCGAARLARFNITTNPLPANPGRPGRKYFVGLPIPAGAGLVAAIVHVGNGEPLQQWPVAVIWLAILLCTSLLMVSRWRYYSFKDINLRKRHPVVVVVMIGGLVSSIYFYSEPVLLAIAGTYVLSGVVTRIGGIIRRMQSRAAPPQDILAQ